MASRTQRKRAGTQTAARSPPSKKQKSSEFTSYRARCMEALRTMIMARHQGKGSRQKSEAIEEGKGRTRAHRDHGTIRGGRRVVGRDRDHRRVVNCR